MTITRAQLLNLLLSLRGTTFARVVTVTSPKLKQGNPFNSSLRKLSFDNVTLGFVYSASVRREEAREGLDPTFEVQGRVWGNRVQGTPIVEHKGMHYLETKIERNLRTVYASQGHVIPSNLINPFLITLKPAQQAHLAKVVKLRDYALPSIQRITLHNVRYIVS